MNTEIRGRLWKENLWIEGLTWTLSKNTQKQLRHLLSCLSQTGAFSRKTSSWIETGDSCDSRLVYWVQRQWRQINIKGASQLQLWNCGLNKSYSIDHESLGSVTRLLCLSTPKMTIFSNQLYIELHNVMLMLLTGRSVLSSDLCNKAEKSLRNNYSDNDDDLWCNL